MAALVETMMSVRETPWHGLGTIVEEAPTSADAIKLAGLDWKVEAKPVFTEAGIQIPGYVANTRDSDNSILGIVTDRYSIVQNAEAFEFTDNLVGDGDTEIRYETAGSLRNGKQVWLLAKMPSVEIVGDKVDPYICFSNTFDGSGAIKVCMTPTRVVCNNTLNVALSNAKRIWSCKHMGDISSKLEEAKYTLGLANKYMEELGISAEKFAETKISDAEVEKVINELFPIDEEKDSARKIRNTEELRDAFYTCYMMPDITKFRGTQWGVINAMSDLVCHSSPARMTDTYKENNWGRIMVGHPLMDALMSKVAA